MIQKYHLDTNDSHFSVWFSGKQIFLTEKTTLLDKSSYYLYNEPRIHSKLKGFEYEDSKDNLWETPYTKYFIKSEKKNNSFHFGFPTSSYLIRYLEKNRLQHLCNTDNIYSYFDEVYKDNIKKTIIKKLKKNKQLYHQIKHFFQEEEKPVFYEMKHMIVLLKNIDKLRTIDARDNKVIVSF